MMSIRTDRTAYALLLLLPLLACGNDDAGTGPDPDPVTPVATSLEITPGAATLAAIGDTVHLEAEVRDQNDAVMADASLTWSSPDTAVATVSSTGGVVAVAEGAARIVAAAGALADTVVVTVEQIPAAVEVSPDSVMLVEGDTIRLAAAIVDSNDVATEDAVLTWSSTDEDVATVDSAGRVDAAAAGVARIVAAAGAVADTVVVTVAQVPAAVEVAPASVSFHALGDSVLLGAVVRDANGHEVVGGAVAWSSADTAVAIVRSDGWLVARGNGTTVVEVVAGGVADTAAVEVEQAAAAVEVSPAAVTVAQGDTVRLTAVVADSNGFAIEDAAVTFTWSSDDATVATVDASGLVTVDATERGLETRITATAGGLEGSVALAVLDRLVFESSRDVLAEIYVMNEDGTSVTNLTNAAGHDLEAVWSPDGTTIAFISHRDGDWEIYAMQADGSAATNLTNMPGIDQHAVWSPDGTLLVFASSRDANREVYVMNADGTGQTRLTHDTEDDLDPRWSPDGARIAFDGERDGNEEIYVMNADGSGVTRVTSDPAADRAPAWQPRR